MIFTATTIATQNIKVQNIKMKNKNVRNQILWKIYVCFQQKFIVFKIGAFCFIFFEKWNLSDNLKNSLLKKNNKKIQLKILIFEFLKFIIFEIKIYDILVRTWNSKPSKRKMLRVSNNISVYWDI